MLLRPCTEADFEEIYTIINDAAEAYHGVIPADRWHDPYMSHEQLRREIDAGVVFTGCEEDGLLLGVMGVQPVRDVTLIRHAYVRTTARRRGIGGLLLRHLCAGIETPILIGTWATATWAIAFYEKYGFRRQSPEVTRHLLQTYWDIPERQIATSVVLARARLG